ncbi:MAG: non-heme iron oxygenase ferredoxin subunit [Steroidobacteraceae bacterium]
MSWFDVGAQGSLVQDKPLAADLGGRAVLVVRCGEELHAVDDLCTHDGEALEGAEVESCQIICPRHGARFCLRTGEALTPPAYEPLRTYAVRIENGRILIERPD